MTVRRSTLNNPWGTPHPLYYCPTFNNFTEVRRWMAANSVEHFLWSTGSGGYTFDVRTNVEWFELKWA